MGITMLTKLVVIVIFTPVFLFPSVGVAVLGLYLGKLYLRSQLSVKREMRWANTAITLDLTVDIC